ncbi:MAG TPA: cbb3-type cytochrome c oxidase subunit I, partial [Pirellula sp.]|nr:cbb3-type cytochrome c oxidase subunit I [Pirellula sp.]
MQEYTNANHSSVSSEKNIPSNHFVYNDSIVRLFMSATVFWSIFASGFGIISGLLLTIPALFGNLHQELQPFASFARFSPLQDSVAIFAFVGNAVFSAVYFSTQRLCKIRLWSNALAYVHFAVWQLIIVVISVASLLGHTQSGLIANAPWPIAVAIAFVWIFAYGLNIFMTILKRRERYLYVSLWFYLASIIAVGLNQIANCCVAPTDWLHSESLLAGMQAAWRQSWYEYNLVAFGLIMPFLGIMYYYLPKAADRPLY